MEFTLVMLILIVLVGMFLLLSKWQDEEHEAEQKAALQSERDRYLAEVYAKYNQRCLPMGFRRRIDFTGERPLTAEELEQVKAEVMR